MRIGHLIFSWLLAITLVSCSSTGLQKETLQTSSHLDATMSKLKQDEGCCTAKGEKFAIVSGGRNASAAALEIIKKGGNAVDAAVAAGFVLCVERPQSTGIGGGGFMTLRWKGKNYFVDFREVAPLKATKNMYLDDKGEIIPGLSQKGGLAVAVPGMVAGFYDIHKKWGKLKWNEVVQPSIRLAEGGMELLPTLAERIAAIKGELAKDPYLAGIFLTPTGEAPAAGSKLVQKDLAETLKKVAKLGPKVFYQGEIARKIIDKVNATGGVFQTADLSKYKVKFRTPVVMTQNGYTLITAPPPSAGGVMMGQMFGMLSAENLTQLANTPPAYIHLLAEAMKRGYADRSVYAGDPDFVKVPVQQLLDPRYIAKLSASIDKAQATPSEKIRPLQYFPNDNGTSGFSLADNEGNAIASTITVNTSFGSVTGVPGTGIVLNNEMDDFSAKTGQANAYGLTGADANSIAPGKRPVSSMTPTVLLKGDKPVAAFSGAGGSRIISGIFQVLMHYMYVSPGDVKAAVFAPRMHHQWIPDQLDLEEGWSESLKGDLEKLGHKVTAPAWQPRVEGVGLTADGKWTAVYDPRDIGGVAAE